MSTVRVPAITAAEPAICVLAKPWPQRVLLQSVGLGAANVFVAPSGGAGIGPKAIQVVGVSAIVVAPNQALYAAGDIAGGLLSLSVSGPIQYARQEGRTKMGASFFDSQRLAVVVGETTPPPQLLPPSDMPRRVSMTIRAAVGGAFAQIAFSAGAALSQPQSFTIREGNVYIFVVAPGQSLYGSIPSGIIRDINVHASDLVVSSPRGATGLPGPAGQE